MAETVGSDTFGVGGVSGTGSGTAPYTGSSSGGGDTPWYQSLIEGGLSFADQLVYSEQERTRDELAAETRQRQIDAQAAVGMTAAQAQAQGQQTMMYALAGVGVIVAVAMIVK